MKEAGKQNLKFNSKHVYIGAPHTIPEVSSKTENPPGTGKPW